MLSVKMKPTFEHSPQPSQLTELIVVVAAAVAAVASIVFVLPASDNVPGQQKPC